MARRINRLFAVACVLSFVIANFASAADLLVDTTWSEDFELGTISGWESYPAFEDTAYDFTIIPGHAQDRYKLQGFIGSGEFFYPVDLAPPAGAAPNTTYLLRAYRPNSASTQQVGAWVKLWLNTSASSVLTFDYWLKPAVSEPTSIEVQLAGADGRRYTKKLASFQTGQWVRASVNVSDLRCNGQAPPAGLFIQALAIVANFNKGDASAYIFFALDNVSLTCKRQCGFTVAQPPAQSFKHWPMQFANKHYNPGQTVNIAATPAASLSSVTARIENSTGALVRGPVSLSQTSGQWSGSLAFLSSDTPGPYMLVLEGADSTGKAARSDVRVWLLKPVAAGTHPRLYFSSSDIPRLQARTGSWDGSSGWNSITSKAGSGNSAPTNSNNQYFPKDYLVPDQTFYNTWVSQLTGPELAIFYSSFVYAINGNSTYGSFAHDNLIKMAGWDQWNHPWFEGQGRYCYYPVGRVTQSLGFAYDAIYGLLSSSERTSVRAGLMKNGVLPAWREYFRDDRVGNNTSNWIHHSTGGPIQALIAMDGELTGDDAANWDIYFSGLMEKAMSLPRYTLHSDGAWGEDYSYQDYAQQGGQPIFAALKQAYGVTGLAQSLNYSIGHSFPIYANHSGNNVLPMGDSHESRTQSSAWVWFAQESNDPVYRWFVNQCSPYRWEDFLWRDTTQPTKTPADAGWPKCKSFPGKGNVVFRTGWNSNSEIVMVYRGGANYNHTHVDQGNFLMSVAGDWLISEANCYSYYYQDPYFWSYFTQSAGHNVVLVDGNPESQVAGDFLSEISAFNNRAHTDNVVLAGPVNFLSSQLEPVYRGALTEYTRRIYFLDSGLAVMFDRLRSANKHKFIWQVYPPQKNMLTINSNSQATIGGSVGSSVKVQVIGGSGTTLRMQDEPIAVPNLMNSSPKPRVALQLVNNTSSTQQDYCIALLPVKWGTPIAQSVTEVAGSGYRGVTLTTTDRQSTILFATVGGQIAGTTSTDGPSACVTTSSGRIIGAAFELATRASSGGKDFFTSDKAINAGVDRTSSLQETWTFNAPAAATVRLTTSGGMQLTYAIKQGDSTITINNSSAASPEGLALK